MAGLHRATLADLAAFREGTLGCGVDGRLCRLDRCDDLDITCDVEGWPSSAAGHWPSASVDLSTVIADALDGCGCGGSCRCR